MISKKDLDEAIKEFPISFFFGNIRRNYKNKDSIIQAYNTYTPKYITLCGIRFYEYLPMSIQTNEYINTVKLCYQSDVATDNGTYPIAYFKFKIYKSPKGVMMSNIIRNDTYIEY